EGRREVAAAVAAARATSERAGAVGGVDRALVVTELDARELHVAVRAAVAGADLTVERDLVLEVPGARIGHQRVGAALGRTDAGGGVDATGRAVPARGRIGGEDVAGGHAHLVAERAGARARDRVAAGVAAARRRSERGAVVGVDRPVVVTDLDVVELQVAVV